MPRSTRAASDSRTLETNTIELVIYPKIGVFKRLRHHWR